MKFVSYEHDGVPTAGQANRPSIARALPLETVRLLLPPLQIGDTVTMTVDGLGTRLAA